MIKRFFLGWIEVSKKLTVLSESPVGAWPLNQGQKDSLKVIAKNIKNNGMIIADEVGMGKTRIAVSIAKTVIESGGRVAIIIPPGLGYQWQGEFREMKIADIDQPIRSLNSIDQSERPHLEKEILLVSHLLASNWNLGEKSRIKRFGLLPEIYAEYRKKDSGIYPRNYIEWHYENERDLDRINQLAKAIVDNTPRAINNSAGKILKEISELDWGEYFFNGAHYSSGKNLRGYLEKAVGLCFGCFDLVIIDEAHKNRGEGTGLSALLKNILLRNQDSRTISLTATPLELNSENWNESLDRIGVEEDYSEVIREFSDALEKVKKEWSLNQKARLDFIQKSKRFEKTLKPYIVRRDKREDDDIKLFEKRTGEPYHNYRRYNELKINPTLPEFGHSWRIAICAAESLSFAADHKEDSVSKRARLTIANGHSLGKWMEAYDAVDEFDKEGIKEGKIMQETVDLLPASELGTKKEQRRIYWKNKLKMTLSAKRQSLYEHPNILESIKFIEEHYTSKYRKILVFGKFTRPLKAFCDLLNARELVRRVEKGMYWPQFTFHGDEDKAVKFALTQLNSKLTVEDIHNHLKKFESKIEYARKKFRSHFYQKLEAEFKNNSQPDNALMYNLFIKIKDTKDSENQLFQNLTRACYELTYGTDALDKEVSDSEEHKPLLEVFKEILMSCLDHDLFKEEEDEIEDDVLQDNIERLKTILKEEYSVQSGRFAKLLNGNTSHNSRRFIQMAFNREKSFPYVLVAQSQVGREGLNLHKSCHSVMMLHPEWNPAVAEQQIGRVDRINGLWSKLARESMSNDATFPRIEIIPVIFEHTYDEQNWNVLMKRWDDLKAHLHGIIISDSEYKEEDRNLIKEINDAAPDFRPT